jgi:hypothetical protein
VEELPAGSLSCPGAYRTVCVQLELHHLAVAALDQAAAMAEMEGAEGLEALGAGAPAFKALRALVQVRDEGWNGKGGCLGGLWLGGWLWRWRGGRGWGHPP